MTSLRVSWLKAAEISSGRVFRKVDRWGYPGKRALCDKAVAGADREAPRRGGGARRRALAAIRSEPAWPPPRRSTCRGAP